MLPRQDVAEALRLWESAGDPRPVARDLALLAAARPDLPHQHLPHVPLGQREAALLHLHRALFGPRLEGVFPCDACGEALAVTLDADTLASAEPSDDAPHDGSPAAEGWVAFSAQGCLVDVRPPDGEDLVIAAAAADRGGPTAARAALAQRVLRVHRDGARIDLQDVPPGVLDRALTMMAECDPAAELIVRTICPRCGVACSVLVDVGRFLSVRIDQQARSMLAEIAALAGAFGWSEAEILAMSPRRRAAYLELAR